MMGILLSTSCLAQSEFKAPWWCQGGHFQTIFGGLFRENVRVSYQRERLELPDGDFLDLDWAKTAPEAPIVLILSGLASSSDSLYVKTLVDEVRTLGWNAVVMNFRGQSGEPNRLNVTNHGGRSQDLDFVIQHLLNQRVILKPEAEKIDLRMTEKANPLIYLVGYSIGANILFKWLGENGGKISPQIQKAAGISGAYDLAQTAQNLDRDWFNRNIYVRAMLRSLKPLAFHHAERFPGSLDTETIRKAETFEVYDREVTAKLNGFKNEKEYWQKSSAMNVMPWISVPSLIIHAANDPFLPAANLPYPQMLASKSLKLRVTEDGGHLGFISGEWPWKQKRWLEKTIMEWFKD